MNGDQYVHRVGRTARAGKDGRAVILLTQVESFFLKINPQLSINPHERQTNILNDQQAKEKISQILETIDEDTKRKAYSAYLGFMRPFSNKLALNPPALVKMANEFAVHGMGCPEPPALMKKTIGMMGLKGVPGLRIAKNETLVPINAKKELAANGGGGRPLPIEGNTNTARATLGKHELVHPIPQAAGTVRPIVAEGDQKEGWRQKIQKRQAREKRMKHDAQA